MLMRHFFRVQMKFFKHLHHFLFDSFFLSIKTEINFANKSILWQIIRIFLKSIATIVQNIFFSSHWCDQLSLAINENLRIYQMEFNFSFFYANKILVSTSRKSFSILIHWMGFFFVYSQKPCWQVKMRYVDIVK